LYENKQPWRDYVLDGTGMGMSGHLRIQPGDPNYEHMRETLLGRASVGTPLRAQQDAAEAEAHARMLRDRPKRMVEAELALGEEGRVEREVAEREIASRAAREEVERVTRELRPSVMSPPGLPSEAELLERIAAPTPAGLWRDVRELPLGGREQWVLSAVSTIGQEERRRAVQALTGELSIERANANLELARRYRVLGEVHNASSMENTAGRHRNTAVERMRADEALGNTDALRRFSEIEARGMQERAEATASTADASRAYTERLGSARAEAAQREASQQAAIAESRRIADAAAAVVAQARQVRLERQAAREQAAAAVQTTLGTPPPARIPATQRDLLQRQETAQARARLMTPDQREAWVNDPNAREEFRVSRRQAVNEMTGAASQARAEYATREAAAFAEAGNTSAARAARTRAVREAEDAATLQTEFATHEALGLGRQSEIVADRVRAAAVLPRVQAQLAAARAQMSEHELAAAVEPLGSPKEMAAERAQRELAPQLQTLSRERQLLERLSTGAYGELQNAGSSLYTEASRQEARQALAAKEGRVRARDNAEEAQRQAVIAAEQSRATALLPAARDAARQRSREANEANKHLYTGSSEERAAARERLIAANAAESAAYAEKQQLQDLAEGRATERDRHVGMQVVAAKEGRIEGRRDAEMAVDSARAEAVLPAAKAEASRLRALSIAASDVPGPRGLNTPEVARAAFQAANAADKTKEGLLRIRASRGSYALEGGEERRQADRGLLTAKEGRISERRVAEASRAAAEAHRRQEAARLQAEEESRRASAEKAARKAEEVRGAQEAEAAKKAGRAERAKAQDSMERLAAAKKEAKAEAARLVTQVPASPAPASSFAPMAVRTSRGRRAQLLRRL